MNFPVNLLILNYSTTYGIEYSIMLNIDSKHALVASGEKNQFINPALYNPNRQTLWILSGRHKLLLLRRWSLTQSIPIFSSFR